MLTIDLVIWRPEICKIDFTVYGSNSYCTHLFYIMINIRAMRLCSGKYVICVLKKVGME